MKFSGPIKTGSAGFPLESLRWTIANVERGEHVVFKLVSVGNAPVLVEEDIYAIGWSDHHLKSYLTTHGEFVRLVPATVLTAPANAGAVTKPLRERTNFAAHHWFPPGFSGGLFLMYFFFCCLLTCRFDYTG